MSGFRVDAIVAGAGVVGLAIGRRLALAGLETLVIERNGAIGEETSSRNSEVIHAGLYYPAGSLKARSCVDGRALLYRYCEARGVPHRRCGKLMLATANDQLAALEVIWQHASANGVTGLRWMAPEAVSEIEPEIRCRRAFLSPDTGIIDSHAYMQALQADLEQAGGMVVLQTPVHAVQPHPGGLKIVCGGAEPTEIDTRLFVNATGHGAPTLAAATVGLSSSAVPQQWYAKGNYFSLAGQQPFSRLVYPLPEAAGLGVHATIDLSGRCRFGPDVEWTDSDHAGAVDPARAAGFYQAIRAYWPALADDTLRPDYAGVRPKLSGPAMPTADFRLDGAEVHGIDGLANLFGIESPGLTASLSLADIVAERLGLPAVALV